MGEVYQATDTNLKRAVAIKVLPASLAADADRLARFQREAEVLAALNHPGIAAIYGLERSGVVTALVMELVEGEDLSQRIARGALPLDEALPIARQIAEALEAAHEHGIVHRDLKPANVKVRPDGKVKVLDFGLAKAIEPVDVGSSSSLSMSPTITTPAMTQAGMILGTAAYMAPEQARGKPVNKRADIWAFSCVLYEMLTGRRAFGGDEVSDTLALVLTRDPDWAALPPDTPASIHRLLRRSLEKDRARRLADISDAKFDIEEALQPQTARAPVTTGASVPAALRAWLPYAVGIGGMLAALFMFVRWAPWRTAPTAALERLRVEIGADASMAIDPAPAVALSPDGTVLAFVARAANATASQLFVRRLDQLEARPLAGTERAYGPFFSPDGRWIGFFAGTQLKKVAVTGGAPVALATAPSARGGSWGDDDAIVFAPDTTPGTRLLRVSAAGGAAEPITPPAQDEVTQRWPQLLPGGKGLLYTSHRAAIGFDDARVMVQPLPSGTPRVVQPRGYHGRYLASGHFIYIADGTLFAAPFDLNRLATTAVPVPVLDGISVLARSGAAQFSVSRNGALAYVPAAPVQSDPISWMDASGKASPLGGMPTTPSSFSFSPDGTRLALSGVTGTGAVVWLYDIVRDTRQRLATEMPARSPEWTPDGRYVSFFTGGASGTPNGELLWQLANGSSPPQRLAGHLQFMFGSWHPANRSMILGVRTEQGRELRILPVEGDDNAGWKGGTPAPFTNEKLLEGAPRFSPDGRWVAFASGETNESLVNVVPYPGGSVRWQISSEPASDPQWSRTARQLFYLTRDGVIKVVDYTVDGDVFQALKPHPFAAAQPSPATAYAVHPDGKRMAVLFQSTSVSSQRQVVLVTGFFDELRRLVR